MQPADVIRKYAGAEIAVRMQHRTKHAGDINSAYWLEYPSIELALESIADDLLAGRVECIVADGKALPEGEIDALTH